MLDVPAGKLGIFWLMRAIFDQTAKFSDSRNTHMGNSRVSE